MSNSVVFLLVPLVAAAVGSVVLWLWSRARVPRRSDLHEQLRALAPEQGSRPAAQPSGIVRLDTSPDEEH